MEQGIVFFPGDTAAAGSNDPAGLFPQFQQNLGLQFSERFFTALGNGGISAAISFLRTLVFQVAAVLILPVFFDIDGVWLSVTAAEILATGVTFAFLVGMRRRYKYM